MAFAMQSSGPGMPPPLGLTAKRLTNIAFWVVSILFLAVVITLTINIDAITSTVAQQKKELLSDKQELKSKQAELDAIIIKLADSTKSAEDANERASAAMKSTAKAEESAAAALKRQQAAEENLKTAESKSKSVQTLLAKAAAGLQAEQEREQKLLDTNKKLTVQNEALDSQQSQLKSDVAAARNTRDRLCEAAVRLEDNLQKRRESDPELETLLSGKISICEASRP